MKKKLTEIQKKTLKNEAFFHSLMEKIVEWKDGVYCSIPFRWPHFLKFRLSNEEFDKIMKIINEELWILTPYDNGFGIEAYFVLNLTRMPILAFSEENIPLRVGGLKEIFDQEVRSERNLFLAKELGIVIKKEFSDYDY
ncbi:MAG: hypothetical protein LBG59_01970 [Candidatus Peribacteria bacterium]|jgi:hypothetical protein|nr:hypothetical protein [Candidatus Peribacteria bacterium]